MGDVASIEPDVASLPADLRSLRPDVSSHRQDAASPHPDVRSPGRDVRSPASYLVSLEADVTSPARDLRSAHPDVASLQRDVTSLRPDVASVERTARLPARISGPEARRSGFLILTPRCARRTRRFSRRTPRRAARTPDHSTRTGRLSGGTPDPSPLTTDRATETRNQRSGRARRRGIRGELPDGRVVRRPRRQRRELRLRGGAGGVRVHDPLHLGIGVSREAPHATRATTTPGCRGGSFRRRRRR